MATKVSIAPEVRAEIENRLGIKFDGVFTLTDFISLISIVMKFLKLPEVKTVVGAALDEWIVKLKASKSKIDDLLIPGILIFRRTFGV